MSTVPYDDSISDDGEEGGGLEDVSITGRGDDRTEFDMLDKERQRHVARIWDQKAVPRPLRCAAARKRLRLCGTLVFGILAVAATAVALVFAIQHSQNPMGRTSGGVPETLLATLERATMRVVDVSSGASARVMYDYRSRKWRSDFQQNAKFAHSILVDLALCTQFLVHYSFAVPRPPICQRVAMDQDLCAARLDALAKGPQSSRLREVVVRGEILEQVTVDEQVVFTLHRRTAVPTAIHVIGSNDTFNVTDYAGGAFADVEWAEAVSMCNETTSEPTDLRAVLGRKCINDVDILQGRGRAAPFTPAAEGVLALILALFLM